MAVKPHNGFGHRDRSTSAFSLVEVVLAMGIVAFALIILVGLLPVGLKSNSDSIGESQAVNLLQALIADRQSTAYSLNSSLYSLPAIATVTSQTTGSLYINEDLTPNTNAPPTGARYRVNYTIFPSTNNYLGATNYPVSGPPQPVAINFQVSWPALQTNRPSSVETTATFMQP